MAKNRQSDGPLPKDALVIKGVLKSLGVRHFEPRAVNKLLDFMHSYIASVLQDAEAYAEQSGRATGAMTTEDVMLAIQTQAEYSFTAPPPQEVLFEVAEEQNALKLPELNPANRYGLRVPPDNQTLTLPNFQQQSNWEGRSYQQ